MRASPTETVSPSRPLTSARALGTAGAKAPFSWLEALGVLVSPLVLYLLLGLRGMAPAALPDPSMHTTFILDPQAIFDRYSALFTPTARLREAARVGFLVPGRIFYLLFGALPGFYAFRYVLALVAIIPLYLLLRRLYGRWAGVVGIAVVISSPVVITAWGTDYPDSAAISYLTGALAALGLSLDLEGPQRAWMLVAAALLTLTVWSHGVSVPLVIIMAIVYTAVRAWREQQQLVADLALMLATALGVTLLLAVGSKLLLGQFNFVTPTLRSASYLSQPAQEAMYHSVSNAWAKYDSYLLVPPAVVVVFMVVFARRLRELPAALLFVGATGALQVIAFFYLQFLGSLQTLEQHYFSSTLWSAVSVMLTLIVAEMGRPVVDAGRRFQLPYVRELVAAVPALIVLAIPLIYEAAGRTPHATWTWRGLALAGALVVVATLHKLGSSWLGRSATGSSPAVLATCAIALVLAGTLALTVALPPHHASIPNTVYDPYPAYGQALGGDDGPYVDSYAVDAQIPAFVGAPSYNGEVLLQWEPSNEFPELQGPMGIYHNAFTWLSDSFPVPGKSGIRKIERWHAAQVVLMSLTGHDFATAVASLRRFGPVVVRRKVLSHGQMHLHVWLVDLTRNMPAAVAARA